MDDRCTHVKYFLSCLLSIGVAFLIIAGFLSLMGEQGTVLTEALKYTFSNQFGIGYSLFYTTPLILTGLSVAFCFHAGLFNIGAEGQLLWGAVAVAVIAHLFPGLPSILAIPLSFLVAALFGGLWGMIPAYFKVKRGTHEVITTILLNFISLCIANYLILYVLKNPESQAAETPVLPEAFRLNTLWFPTTPVNGSLLVAILIAFWSYYYLYFTPSGFELRTMGASHRAALFAGVPTSKRTLSVFFISGCLAGLVATNDVMGNEHKLIEGFSPGYGFTGIAVAIMAKNHPLGIILTSFLFGSLQNFSRELEFFSENITKEMSLILQALLIILISTRSFWTRRRKHD